MDTRAAGRPKGQPASELARLRDLASAIRDIHVSTGLPDTIRAVSDRAREIIGANQAVTSYRVDQDGPLVSAVALSPTYERRKAPRVSAPAQAEDLLEALRGARVRFGPAELAASPVAERLSLLTPFPPTTSLLAAPILDDDGRTIGLIQLTDKADGEFGPADEAMLAQIADMAAVAIDNARLSDRAVEAQRRLGTQTRRERRRTAELQAVIESLADAVLVFDEEREVRLTNSAADILFEPAPVRSYRDLVARFDPPLPSTESGDDTRRGVIERRLAGSRPARWIQVRISPVSFGAPGGERGREPAGSIAILRDVTRERAKRAQRDAFLGVLSHELRTPVTTIFAGSIVLQRTAPDSLSRELAADVAAEADRLYRLVQDLLVLTRDERGVLDVVTEPILLQHILPTAAGAEIGHWPAASITSTIPRNLPAVSGDPTYVEQVARNLLSNAMKYGEPGGEVEMVVEVGDEEVCVRVLDRGPGFGSADGPELFDLFQPAPGTAAQAAGGGIGLAVCRRLVDAMGGRIWARGRAGGGSEFGFALRRYEDDVQPEDPSSVSAAARNGD